MESTTLGADLHAYAEHTQRSGRGWWRLLFVAEGEPAFVDGVLDDGGREGMRGVDRELRAFWRSEDRVEVEVDGAEVGGVLVVGGLVRRDVAGDGGGCRWCWPARTSLLLR